MRTGSCFCVVSLLVVALPTVLLAGTSSLEAIYREGDAAPGGGVFETFRGSANVNNAGQVAFYADLADGNTGIWRDGDRIVRTGLPGPDSQVITSFADAGSVSINNHGALGFYAATANYAGVYTDTALVDYTGRSPGGGAVLHELWVPLPWLNDSGACIYYGEDTNTGDDYILRDQAVLYETGDPAPGGGAFDGGTWVFWRPVHNNAGQIAFYGEIDGVSSICTPTEVLAQIGQPSPIGGVWSKLPWGANIDSAGVVSWVGTVDIDGALYEGVFTKDGAIALAGELAPNGMEYSRFWNLPCSNAFGQWMFSATVIDPATSGTLDGMFTPDEVIALEGEKDAGGWTFDSGRRPSLSDEGWFTFSARCDEGMTVYRGYIPEPASLTLLALGGLAVMRRRKRSRSAG